MENLKINNLNTSKISKNKKIYFLKNELSLILSVYSKYVSKGIWKDYAIDNKDQFALFSFYRHTYEYPIYSIEKKAFKNKKEIIFNLFKKNKQMYSSNDLRKVINKINHLPKLVNKN